MERIDVLKGIRQILIQKAYETGHISHRADGDWQKQADGSWKPYKGQSTPQTQKPTKDTEYSEITEEDLKVSTPIKNKLSKEEKSDINNKLYDVLSFYDSDAKELFGMNRTNNGELDGSPSISYDWRTDRVLPADKDKFDKMVRHYMDKAGVEDTPLNYKQAYNTIKGMAINNGMLKRTNHPLDSGDEHVKMSPKQLRKPAEYGEITEEDLKGSNTTDTSNIDTKEKKRDVQNKIDGVFKLRDEDTKKMLGIRRDDSKEHGYDGEIRFYADGNRNIKPASDRKEFDKVVQYYLDKAGLEDTPFNHKVAHKYIVGYAKNNGLIGDYYWSKVLYPNGYGSDDENVEKSAVRDMRSIPTVKNMGF